MEVGDYENLEKEFDKMSALNETPMNQEFTWQRFFYV